MAGGPLRVVATAGAAVAAGMFTLSMASSVSLNVLSTVVERQRVLVPTRIHRFIGHFIIVVLRYWYCLNIHYLVCLGDLSLQKKTAPQCACCKGRGFTECRLCKGESTIDWSPLYDPVISRPCVCPTCDGNK